MRKLFARSFVMGILFGIMLLKGIARGEWIDYKLSNTDHLLCNSI